MELNRRNFLRLSAGTTGLLLLGSSKPVYGHDSLNQSRYGVLVDTTKCIGCWWCYAACKHNRNLPETVRPEPENPPKLDSDVWTTLATRKEGNKWFYAKRQCMHCEYPACVTACPVGALQKTADGPVVYNVDKCFGCRYCMVACPFGVPDFEWKDPTPWVRKCDFCADRLAEGLEPFCVAACTTGALKFGNREELLAEARERIAATPRKYVDHIYGEKEVGGTSWLYITGIPIEKMGFPSLDSEPVTLNTERAMGAVPPVLFGVAAMMAGVYWICKRHNKISRTENSKTEIAE